MTIFSFFIHKQTGEAKNEKESLSFPQNAAEKNLVARAMARTRRRPGDRAPGLRSNHAAPLNFLYQYRPPLGAQRGQ
jgi:hypothetical protein